MPSRPSAPSCRTSTAPWPRATWPPAARRRVACSA